ncbi:MAG: O-antigen ligase family protein, partial [Proteobacteria bacterium]|nr:O-antigen ligase family protein [Pseudomonadota bacterium]
CSGLALWALAQHFVFTDFLTHGQARHPFSNPNSYAALLSLAFFPSLGAMMTARSRIVSNAAAFLCFLLLGAMFVIGGRLALLCLIVAAAIFLFFAREMLWRHRRRLVFVILGAAAVAALAGIDGASRQIPLHRLAMIGTDPGSLVWDRLYIWQATLAMIRDHFPFGAGIGTFFLFYPQYRLPQEVFSGGFMAHNDPLQFFAEMGIAAPVLFYICLLLVFLRMMRFWSGRSGLPDGRAIMTMSVFCGLGAMAVHAHADFNFYAPPLLVLAGLQLAWWHREIDAASEPRELAVKASPGWLVPALPLVAALFILQGFLRSEYHANRAKDLLYGGDMAGFAAAVDAANDAGWGWNARPYILASAVPLAVLGTEGGSLSAPERGNLISQTEGLLARAEAQNPRLVALPYSRARLFDALGNEGDAQKQLQDALALNPAHAPSRLMLSSLLEKAGNGEQGYALLKEGLQWRIALQDARGFYMAVMAAALARGDIETHRIAAEKMKIFALAGPEGVKSGSEPPEDF